MLLLLLGDEVAGLCVLAEDLREVVVALLLAEDVCDDRVDLEAVLVELRAGEALTCLAEGDDESVDGPRRRLELPAVLRCTDVDLREHRADVWREERKVLLVEVGVVRRDEVLCDEERDKDLAVRSLLVVPCLLVLDAEVLQPDDPEVGVLRAAHRVLVVVLCQRVGVCCPHGLLLVLEQERLVNR